MKRHSLLCLEGTTVILMLYHTINTSNKHHCTWGHGRTSAVSPDRDERPSQLPVSFGGGAYQARDGQL